MASSFKKKSNRGRGTYPAGTKVSLHNNQLLISSGVPSLDTILGGGLPVGSVLLLGEDNFGSYAKTLVNCFLAEGVASRHSVFLAVADVESDEIWQNLPCPVDDQTQASPKDESQLVQKDNDMKIAWRYQNLPKVQPTQTAAKFGHFFDFTKTIDPKRLDRAIKYEFNARKCWLEESDRSSSLERPFFSPLYRKLLNKIKEIIEENGHCTTNQEPQDRTILRIAILSIESPLWGASDGNTADCSLTLFLYYLRGLMRSSYAVCVVTIPSYLKQDSCLLGRAERLSDTVIRLESFAGSNKETNPMYKEYHGLFHLVRLPKLNALSCHMPETFDLAFKLRRKKFVIEKLHLPPDVSETDSPVKKDLLNRKTTGAYSCGASLAGSKLDF